METPNAEAPRLVIMWILTPLMVLFALFMYLFFSDNWTTARIIGQAAFSLMAFGMVIATIFPKEGWWGLRIVAFVIFAGYLSYLVNQFIFEANEIDPAVTRASASPFNALLGFLFFGIPCLLYSLWGSTWGKLGHEKQKNINAWDLATFYVAWGAQWLFIILSMFATIAIVWKSIES